jgi:hypothetical protein
VLQFPHKHSSAGAAAWTDFRFGARAARDAFRFRAATRARSHERAVTRPACNPRADSQTPRGYILSSSPPPPPPLGLGCGGSPPLFFPEHRAMPNAVAARAFPLPASQGASQVPGPATLSPVPSLPFRSGIAGRPFSFHSDSQSRAARQRTMSSPFVDINRLLCLALCFYWVTGSRNESGCGKTYES